MKGKAFAISLLLLLPLGLDASAQLNADRKRFESNICFGAGMFAETGNPVDRPGVVLRLSYGLDIRFNDNWSLMPGVGLKSQVSDIAHLGWVGGDADQMSAIDLSCIARHHYSVFNDETVIGLGPQITYMFHPDRYYYDADPSDPIGNKEKFHRFDICLQPSIQCSTSKHSYWGIEAIIGLRNMMVQYPFHSWTTGNIHLHNVMFIYGWIF